MTVTSYSPSPFQSGYRLIDGSKLNKYLALDLVSSADGLTAHAGGGQTNALPLTAIVNRVTVVASPNDSVLLPPSQPGLRVTIENATSTSMQVFGTGTDTINGVAFGTGIAQVGNAFVTYMCTTVGAWQAAATSDGSFGALTATTINGNTITTGTGTLTLQGSATFTGPALSGTAATLANAETLTNKTLTAPIINNPAIAGPAPVAVGATATVGGSSGIYLLNTASGSVATLPAATGSGNKYKFIVTTAITSNSHKILAATTADFIAGVAVGHVAAGTTLSFSAVSTTMHSVQMPSAGTTPSGGAIGDWFEFTDIAANLWEVSGAYLSGTTSTTPFSTADS